MFFTIIIAFISLIGLIILHEFGHFLLAKKFGVKVEEFGIGYPPRLFGKKFGETIYSLNLLPFGAFVRIYGQEKAVQDSRSFTTKPFWQRTLIISGGVISFWIISAVLLSFVMALGAPTMIEDNDTHNLTNPNVQITMVSANSPAESAGIRIGDFIKSLNSEKEFLQTTKVGEVQDFIQRHKGEEIVLTIQRGKNNLNISLVPRVSPPGNEGAIGVALVRTALKVYPWYQAPVQGVIATVELTWFTLRGWAGALVNLFERKPTGVQLLGPVGIFHLFTQISQLGISYFLQFIAIISIYLALFNLLPIPITDGGKLVFLITEKIRKKPLNQKIEQNLDAVFFILLITLLIWVTIKEIIRFF